MLATVLLTLTLVALCVLVHFEAFNAIARLTHGRNMGRVGLLITMFGLLLAHVIEIAIFGVGILIADLWQLGTVLPPVKHAADAFYYSAIVYTTVGFGDLVPEGGVRWITGAEALVGLALITWSASFTFLQMQRYWPGSNGDA